MPLAAPIAQSQGTARSYGIYMAGWDLVMMVPIDSVRVIEAGPNGVSSMDFTIEDPDKIITLQPFTEIVFRWQASEQILFRGYIDHWSDHPDFGGVGRAFDVSCSGVEIWLDWLVVYPAITYGKISGGHDFNEFIVSYFAQISNTPIHGFVDLTGSSGPVKGIANRQSEGNAIGNRTATDGSYIGVTVREMVNQAVALSTSPTTFDPADSLWTVDFDMGFRFWGNYTTSAFTNYDTPSDYTTLTIVDTSAGTTVAANLKWDVLPTDITRTVYIKGFDAASSGIFTDGTGLPGKQAYVNDVTITTAADATARALSVLRTGYISIRGSLDLEDWTPATTIHPGSLLDLTDASTGATGIYRIFQIEKTFNSSGRQNWTVSFGGLPPSAMALTRKLTT